MLKRFILLFVTALLAYPACAQVNIMFVPEIYGRNVNGLLECKILSTNQRLTASLTVTVRERKEGTVCVLRTGEFLVVPGTNTVPATAARSGSVQFANSRTGRIIGQSKLFPTGEYDYCFALTIRNTDNPPFEQCFSYSLAPFTELSLIDPFNKDTICSKRPVLSWEPLIPAIPGSYYQLVLSEVKTGQNATEALNYNLPLINQRSLISPVLPYPSMGRELQQGKKYAWQVTAYKDLTILNRSAVWEFVVDCKDSLNKDEEETDNGYRDIEEGAYGNFYAAHGKLKLMIVNDYAPQDLNYEIYAVIGYGQKIKRLPKVRLLYGKNKVSIDLANVKGLVPHQYYVMNILFANGDRKSLRFLYEKAN